MPLRFDIGRTDKHIITDQGFMRADARLTRTGIFKYKMYDGSIRKELRSPEEVFHVDSLASLSAIPVTNEHPPGMLDSENTKYFQIGFTGEKIDRDGIFVKNRITVTDANTIREITDERKVELSCGYNCEIVDEPGEFKGETYDAIQKNIRYNHVSVDEKGRAGVNVKIKLDRMDAIMIEGEEKPDNKNKTDNKNNLERKTDKGGDTMLVKIKVDGIEYEVSEHLASKIVEKGKKIDSMTEELKTNTAKFEELKGKHDGLEVEMKKKDEEIEKIKADKPCRADIMKEAKSRNDLEDVTKQVLTDEEVKTVNFDEATDIDLKKLCITKIDEKIDLAEKSDEYVAGMFEIVKKGVSNKDNKDNHDTFKKAIGDSLDNTGEIDLNKKRQDKMKADSELWKKPLNKVSNDK